MTGCAHWSTDLELVEISSVENHSICSECFSNVVIPFVNHHVILNHIAHRRIRLMLQLHKRGGRSLNLYKHRCRWQIRETMKNEDEYRNPFCIKCKQWKHTNWSRKINVSINYEIFHITVTVIRPMYKRMVQIRSSTKTRRQFSINKLVAVIADGQNHLPLTAV